MGQSYARGQGAAAGRAGPAPPASAIAKAILGFLRHAPAPVTGYRKDIEGLRAVAVVPILLFHLNVAGFGGGFVGVDIFFVISGYLIGGMLIAQVDAGEFSIARFYQRRLRRIIPALSVVLLATFLAGLVLLLPADLERLSDSILASLIYAANVYFWWTTDYFSQDGEGAPLLHLWSLGVEEQFYLLFPLLVLGIARLERRALWGAIALVAFMSFAVSVHLTFRAPQANFFLLHARAWELLAGVLVAITPLPFLKWRMARELAAFASLAPIAWAIATYHEYTPFPGWRAAIPCLGAAGVIAAGRYGPSLIGQALSTALPCFFGRISYSLYLWHWPVIVFLLMAVPLTELTPALQLFAGGLSVLLAVLSLHYVERPFRKSEAPLKAVFGWSAAAAGVTALLAGAVLASGGWPGRFDAETRRIAAALDYPQDRMLRAGTCFLIEDAQRFDRGRCLAAGPGKPRVVLLGDSHAAHLWPGLDRQFPGSAILQITASGCRPLIGQPANTSQRCRQLIGWAFDDYLRRDPPDLVILAGFWKGEDMRGLQATLAELDRRGQRVLLVGPVPAWSLSVPRLLALGRLHGDAQLPDRFLRRDRAPLDAQMRRMAARHGQSYVSPLELRCSPGCRYLDPAGNPLVVDDAHMSGWESAWVAARFHDPALVR